MQTETKSILEIVLKNYCAMMSLINFNNKGWTIMTSKQLLALAAAAVFMLTACGQKTNSSTKDKKAEDHTEQLMEEAEKSEEVTPSIGLSTLGGEWTTEGYVFTGSDPVEIAGEVKTDKEFAVYLLDESHHMIDKTTDAEFTFEVPAPAADEQVKYVVGTSSEDLGDTGSTIEDLEKFVRYENVIAEYGEDTPADEE